MAEVAHAPIGARRASRTASVSMRHSEHRLSGLRAVGSEVRERLGSEVRVLAVLGNLVSPSNRMQICALRCVPRRAELAQLGGAWMAARQIAHACGWRRRERGERGWQEREWRVVMLC